MPGCDLLQSLDFHRIPLTVSPPGSATFALPIPNATVLIGLSLYLQALAFAPGANPANAIVSNGLAWTIGNT